MTAQPGSRAGRFGWNMVWTLGGQTCLVVLNFLLVPFLIDGLGLDGYALYSYLGIISGLLVLLTFGAGTATTKFSAEYSGSGDRRKVSEIFTIGLAAHAVFVALGAVALFALRNPIIDRFLQVESLRRADAVWVVACAAAAAVPVSLLQFSTSFLQGFQRFAHSNALRILQSALVLGGGGVLLYMGWGLREIGIWFAVVLWILAASGVATAALIARPHAETALRAPESETTSRFTGFAGHTFLAQLAWSVVFQSDKLFISFFLPIDRLAYYFVASSVLQRLWVLPNAIGEIAFPMISEMSGRGESEAMGKLYRLSSLLVLWIVIPGFMILALFSPQFLTLWIGSDFSVHGTWPMRWLTLGYFMYLTALIPATAAYAVGRPQYALYWTSAQAVTVVVLWPVLIPAYGISGAAFGFFAAQALTGIPCAALVSRSIFGMGLIEYARRILLRPLGAGLALLAVLWPLRMRAYGWPGLIALSVAGAAFYYALSYRILGDEERDMARVFFEKVRARLSGFLPKS
jgi:O-antigen/teichoic acid export membrane protein